MMRGYGDGALKEPDGLTKTLAGMFPEPSRFEVKPEPLVLPTSPRSRGIVTLAGGPVYSLNAYLLCRLLRDLGCTLPIEWCYLGEELSLAWIDLIRRTIPDVRLVDLGGSNQDNTKGKGGWQAKVESIIQSQFEELLFLDADSHPMRDPSCLFGHPLFQRHDCILWPDIQNFKPGLQAAIQAHHGVNVQGREVESGQMLFRPAKCRGLLEKARAINQNSGTAYKYLHGDKDTFLIGGLQSGDSFTLNRHNPRKSPCCGKLLVQHDLDGRPMFTHLTGSKWTPDEVSSAKGVDYPHRNRLIEFFRQVQKTDVMLHWRRIWEMSPMRVRDTFSASEALRIIQDDSYKIRPMISYRVPVRWIVDVGGNAGAFTIAASAAFPEAEIICIEPDPELMDDIRWNTRNCQAKIHYIQAACVGDGVQEVEFVRTPESRAGSHVAGRKEGKDAGGDSRLTVPAVRLPALLERHVFESIDILKIDAEGVEAEILADLAATGWLEKTHWIRGEWHGREQWPIIHAALDTTHVVALEDLPLNGEMIAHNRQDT
jgi:FkbM family methyltransferase